MVSGKIYRNKKKGTYPPYVLNFCCFVLSWGGDLLDVAFLFSETMFRTYLVVKCCFVLLLKLIFEILLSVFLRYMCLPRILRKNRKWIFLCLMFCLYRIGVLFFALIFCKLFGAKKIVRKKGEEI